jgi:multicomponent Na+:H+ antiporter subunit F
MENVFVFFGIILLVLIGLVFIRIIKGPTALDRLICVNIIGTKSIILIIFLGIVFERLDMFVDIAIAYGMLNFITSIAAAKFYQHKRSLTPKNKKIVEQTT